MSTRSEGKYRTRSSFGDIEIIFSHFFARLFSIYFNPVLIVEIDHLGRAEFFEDIRHESFQGEAICGAAFRHFEGFLST